MKKIISIMVALVLAGFLVYAITYQKKETPVEKPGKVFATTAYVKYFGAAPSVDKGTAYAFVIFFPSAKAPGKVVPFPFFTFDEASIKKVAVERLLAGMDAGSYRGEFVQFPGGMRLNGFNEERGTVTLDFSGEFGAPEERAAGRALALTLKQFEGVGEVRILAGGKESRMSAPAKNVDESLVQGPSPPRLLSVTAMKDKGARNIEDVNAFFDRPVQVRELKMLARDGQPFSGDMFHSVFDMAAVLKPKEPSQFRERMPIRVVWKVADKLGREADGDNVWLLEVKEH